MRYLCKQHTKTGTIFYVNYKDGRYEQPLPYYIGIIEAIFTQEMQLFKEEKFEKLQSNLMQMMYITKTPSLTKIYNDILQQDDESQNLQSQFTSLIKTQENALADLNNEHSRIQNTILSYNKDFNSYSTNAIKNISKIKEIYNNLVSLKKNEEAKPTSVKKSIFNISIKDCQRDVLENAQSLLNRIDKALEKSFEYELHEISIYLDSILPKNDKSQTVLTAMRQSTQNYEKFESSKCEDRYKTIVSNSANYKSLRDSALISEISIKIAKIKDHYQQSKELFEKQKANVSQCILTQESTLEREIARLEDNITQVFPEDYSTVFKSSISEINGYFIIRKT